MQLGSPQAAFGRLALFSEQDPADFAVNGQQLKITTAQDNVGVAPVRSPQQGLLALPVALINFAITVVNTVLTQFVGGGPTPPAQPPLLFALLAFVRNEFQRSFGPAPVADAITTSENTQTTFTAAELLDNDTDIPGEVLKITDWSDPAHGIVRRNTDGTFTYTPNANFSGTDTFTYTMSDEDNPFHIHFFAKSYDEPGHTATATVTVTVDRGSAGHGLQRHPLSRAPTVWNTSSRAGKRVTTAVGRPTPTATSTCSSAARSTSTSRITL